MDALATHNRARWNALAEAGIAYSRPIFGLTPATARDFVDPSSCVGEIAGLNVLCLAGGGGQQSAAFGLLGANVTVLDLADTQLLRDRQAAAHYHLSPRLEQGDMRDLSRFGDHAFDLVYHAHSLGFVPDAAIVFDQVERVPRPGGSYRLSWANPFIHGMLGATWCNGGYRVNSPYADGEATDEDDRWDVTDGDGNRRLVAGPREFCHKLSTVCNDLTGRGFRLLGIWEEGHEEADANAEPGSWAHFTAMFPPWLCTWWRKGL